MTESVESEEINTSHRKGNPPSISLHWKFLSKAKWHRFNIRLIGQIYHLRISICTPRWKSSSKVYGSSTLSRCKLSGRILLSCLHITISLHDFRNGRNSLISILLWKLHIWKEIMVKNGYIRYFVNYSYSRKLLMTQCKYKKIYFVK